ALREPRWWGRTRRRRAAPCACLRVAHMAEESTLERGDAHAMGSLHLRGRDVAHRRTDVLMVGERLDLKQVSRGAIERAQDTGANRGEREVRQTMPPEELTPNE